VLAFQVTLRSGQRYTVGAEELRFTHGGYLELWGFPPATEVEPYPGKRVVALFPDREVVAVVAKEHLVAEERGEPIAPPLVVNQGDDAIPF
jgi:hypothetical protein